MARSGLQFEHDADCQHRDPAEHLERCATSMREHLVHGRVEQPDGRGYAGALNAALPTISSQQTNGTAIAASCATYGISPPIVTITTPPNGAVYNYGRLSTGNTSARPHSARRSSHAPERCPRSANQHHLGDEQHVLGDRGRHRRAVRNRHRSLHGHRGASKSNHLRSRRRGNIQIGSGCPDDILVCRRDLWTRPGIVRRQQRHQHDVGRLRHA